MPLRHRGGRCRGVILQTPSGAVLASLIVNPGDAIIVIPTGRQTPLDGDDDGPQVSNHHCHTARTSTVLPGQRRKNRQAAAGRTVRRHSPTAAIDGDPDRPAPAAIDHQTPRSHSSTASEPDHKAGRRRCRGRRTPTDPAVGGERCHRAAKRGTDFLQDRRRRNRITQMRSQKRHHLPAHLKVRHVTVEVDPFRGSPRVRSPRATRQLTVGGEGVDFLGFHHRLVRSRAVPGRAGHLPGPLALTQRDAAGPRPHPVHDDAGPRWLPRSSRSCGRSPVPARLGGLFPLRQTPPTPSIRSDATR